jgi:hypothetical protein
MTSGGSSSVSHACQRSSSAGNQRASHSGAAGDDRDTFDVHPQMLSFDGPGSRRNAFRPA